MWITRFVTYLSRSLSSCNRIKTFDFSTLYTTIPRSKLKERLRELVQLCFIKKNDQRRYKYFVLGRDISYFVKHHSDSTKKFSEIDIVKMLEFLIDNIFAMFGGHTFGYKLRSSSHQLVPLFVCGRLHTEVLKKNEKKLARSFNFTSRYIDDVFH